MAWSNPLEVVGCLHAQKPRLTLRVSWYFWLHRCFFSIFLDWGCPNQPNQPNNQPESLESNRLGLAWHLTDILPGVSWITMANILDLHRWGHMGLDQNISKPFINCRLYDYKYHVWGCTMMNIHLRYQPYSISFSCSFYVCSLYHCYELLWYIRIQYPIICL